MIVVANGCTDDTADQAATIDPLVPVYLNRLSDLLFILARQANVGHDDVLWKPGGERP